jgi:hypothetical protein
MPPAYDGAVCENERKPIENAAALEKAFAANGKAEANAGQVVNFPRNRCLTM